jgi:sugar lactone lactonase YvrE
MASATPNPSCFMKRTRSRFTHQSSPLPMRIHRCFPACLVFLFALALTSVHAQTVKFPGLTAVGSTATAQTATIAVKTSGTIRTIKVRTLGSDGFDYSTSGTGTCAIGASFSAGQTCTLAIGFKPTAPGDRPGAAVLLDSHNNTLGSIALDGLATGPVGVFVPGVISTVAGDAYWIYAGDGGQATASNIFLPFGIAVDAAGDLFIADSSNDRIREVNGTTGIISTIAGNGVAGFSGDGDPATSAEISNPTSVILDPAGNLYFADTGNNAIRRIDAFTGIISTVAGKPGGNGYSGDGAPATAALLYSPNGICLDDSGNLYIADTGNNAIRMVGAASGIISTVAGTGVASYTGDGGQATSATLNQPWGVAASAAGGLYIADQGNNAIRLVTSGTISTIVGNGTSGFSGDLGPAANAQLNIPSSIAIDVAGNLYVADTGNNRVRKVNASTGEIVTIAGSKSESISGDGGPANLAGIYGPYGLALDGQGSLYIADVFHNRIRKVSANAATLSYDPIRVGRTSPPDTQFLENDGNANLNISSMTPVTNAALDSASTTCVVGTPLTPLGQCIVGADFAPTSTGAIVAGSIDIDSDAANSPGVITVEGQVLSVDPTTLAVTSSNNPSITGSTIVFTVTATSAGATPTGTVTLLDGTTILATVGLASGVANYTTSALTAGTHTITATYGGDSSNAAGTSPALTQVVHDAVAATTASIASSSNPVIAGAPLKLSANVQVSVAGSGAGTISGTVTFYDGANSLGVAVLSNGAATISVTSLAPGTHSLTGVYSGNSNYGASTSSALSQKVTLATSSTALASGANPSSAGGSLTLTANVSSNGGIPTGPVTFFDGSTKLGVAPLNSSGAATLTLTGTVWTVGTHILTASYAGDTADAASVSPALNQLVNLATTTVALTASANPIGQGASITFSAAVSGSGGTPSGSVQFLDGATVIGTGTANAKGVATFATTALALGNHTITAAYAGDPYDAASSSGPVTEVIQTATTAVAIAAGANPATFGNALVLTATVTGTGAVPTGSVTFLDAGLSIGTGTLSATGVATFSTSTLALGSHTLVASYTGDSVHSATQSSALTENVVQGTTTTLTASALQAYAGTPLLWTVTVMGANGKPVTGSVALLDGTSTLANLTLSPAGVATYTSSALTPGTHTVTAGFAGDANDAASTSTPVATLVSIAITTTTVASSVNPALTGAPIIFTATVTGNGGIPGGSVTLLDGTASLGTAKLAGASLNSSVATLTLSTLASGVHTITAQYVGDTDNQPSLSPALSEGILQQTGVTLASSANPSLLTDTVTFTATVSNGAPGAGPTGTVTLTDGGASVATATLGASGIVTFTVAAPTLGTHTMVASYSGDTDNKAAVSPNLIQTVVLRPTSNSFTASASSLSAGQPLILVGVVTGSGSRNPTGTVSFVSGSTNLGAATLNAAGVASMTVTPSPAIYNVISTYSGDSLFAPSSSAPAVITVGPTVEFTLAATPNTMSMQSGAHGSLSITLTTAPTFTDTISLGCAGLPVAATCTFSQGSIPVSGGAGKTLTVTVDTGDPLGAGATAQLQHSNTGSAFAFLLPAGLLALLFGKRKRLHRPLGLLLALIALGGIATLGGCANSLAQNKTPAGSYTFRIIGTGNATGATQSTGVQLTVTQ